MSKTNRTKTRTEKHFTYDSGKSPQLRTIWLTALQLDAEHERKLFQRGRKP